MIEDMTASDKIAEIEVWLFDVKHELDNESISYEELAQIDNIYESVKVFLSE